MSKNYRLKKKEIFESIIKFASTLVCGMKLKNSICISNCIIMLHRFPRDEASWKQWVKIIGRDGWVPSKHSVLCSDHFTEDSFAVYNNRIKKRIKPGALPIIEPQGNISVENNCAGKKKYLFQSN